MSPDMGQCVDIDISEDFLDVYLHPAGKEVRPPHSDEGAASLIALLRDYTVERVVLESTGGLQRRLVRSLQEAGYSVSVVTDRVAGRRGPASGREREVPAPGVHPGRASPGASEAVHGGVQRAEVQPGDRGDLRPPGVAWEEVQAGADGVHAESAGVDEHAGGPGAALGPIARDPIPSPWACLGGSASVSDLTPRDCVLCPKTRPPGTPSGCPTSRPSRRGPTPRSGPFFCEYPLDSDIRPGSDTGPRVAREAVAGGVTS
jgi:hypothetical protein